MSLADNAATPNVCRVKAEDLFAIPRGRHNRLAIN